MARIYKADIWPHRCRDTGAEAAQVSFEIHVPGTPTGAESQTWAIYQVLHGLGEILTLHGFNTHDIGTLYDHSKLPHLGVLFRFPWSDEMRTLFADYGEDLKAIRTVNSRIAPADKEKVKEQAATMWDAV